MDLIPCRYRRDRSVAFDRQARSDDGIAGSGQRIAGFKPKRQKRPVEAIAGSGCNDLPGFRRGNTFEAICE